MFKLTEKRLWWAIHNLVAHPLMEVLFWCGQSRVGDWLHDETAKLAQESKDA